ncbi:MAG: ATPase V [Spirochaetaceae bacterium]|nr:MAG: ATPase V [Spirochaetaceae bacterium]
MIFTEPMQQVVAVVLDHHADAVTKELLRLGLLHLVSITEVDRNIDSKVEAVTPKVAETLVAEIRRRIEGFYDMVEEKIPSGEDLKVEDLQAVDLEETNKVLDALAAGVQAIRDRQSARQQEILRLTDIQRQLELFGSLGEVVEARSQYSYLSVHTGSIRGSLFDSFQAAMGEIPSVMMEIGIQNNQTLLLLITMKRDEGLVDRVLDKFGWTDAQLPQELSGKKDQVRAELAHKLQLLHDEQEELKTQAESMIREKLPILEQLWRNLRLNELYARVQSFFSKTARTVIFSGWLPTNKRTVLTEAVRSATGDRCYLEWHPGREVSREHPASVPVQMHNPKFLSPFQMLVTNYSVPEYGSIDPTPLVAVAYLIMFGLMFGDAGHGAVLLVLGILGSLLYRGTRTGVRNLLRLIAYCGGAAVVTGVLFGSYFGMQWFPPLWFDYHGVVAGHGGRGLVTDIYGILLITIYFGIAVIALGLALNWVNCVVKRRWFRLVFDKGGLIGGWIYAAGVYAAMYFVRHDYRQLPDANLLILLIGLPVFLLTAKPVLEYLLHKPRKSFTLLTPVDFFMEWIVEILEIFSGYLANTLSFMRVAGLGIAHVSLMMAFFSIAGMIGGPSGSFTIGSYLVLIAGNALVILLEGLSAGIQSLRLNYYEFFSKYFSGSGRAYAPVTLRKTSA